ncbi:cytidine deaminase [Chitinophagaceae bacterium MMS25-I14]
MEQFQFAYQRTLISQLPLQIQGLIEAAQKATEKAYAPYSNFKVGAAVLLTDNTILTGANHENASFPAGVCAERAVLGNIDMDSANKVTAIAVAYKSESNIQQPLSPCGLCRQTILEVQLHQQLPIALYMTSSDGQVIVVEDAKYLLPFFFSNDFLGS